jgi:hypothetical protein
VKNTNFYLLLWCVQLLFLIYTHSFFRGHKKTEEMTDFDEISLVISLNFFITLNNQFNFLPRGSF